MADRWESFKYDDSDPWLGTGAQFDHFPLQDRNGDSATGFYWFYPCEKGPNNPFFIKISGGPGMCCLTYAFDDPNPLIIDEQNLCFTKNPNSLTKDFNMLLFECPTGSGYSKISTPILKELGEHQKIICQTFQYLIKKFPTLATERIFFIGESHAGKSIPLIVETLAGYENFGLTIGGLI
jgi:carboxypeptidase C (cathepsin A)